MTSGNLEDYLPSRREVLIGGSQALAAALLPLPAFSQSGAAGVPASRGPNLALVSRHLQWTSAEHGIEVAKRAGFPGILWTVRSGAHIVPANVRTELPRIVRLSRENGLATPMIITSISGPDSEGADAILGTMQELGITLYRAGAPRYDYNQPIDRQFAAFRAGLERLAVLNDKYGTTAALHTHSYANSIGGSGWDLWIAERGLDATRIGINYDIGHVMAKGGAGWRESIRAIGPYLHSVSIKDFLWEKLSGGPAGEWPWRTRFVMPGEGMVDFLNFFRYLQSINFTGPLEVYYEYMVDIPGGNGRMNMLGNNFGEWNLEIPKETFVAYLERDIQFYKLLWERALANPNAPDFSVNAERS